MQFLCHKITNIRDRAKLMGYKDYDNGHPVMEPVHAYDGCKGCYTHLDIFVTYVQDIGSFLGVSKKNLQYNEIS